MPLLLLLPLLLVAVLVLWLVLLPFSIVMRYRHGRARRRAQGWVTGANAWLLLVSVLLFAITAAIAQYWLVDALRDAGIGLAIGVVAGIIGIWLTRIERIDGALYYTPNRWVVLTLTGVVAARLLVGFWMTWRGVSGAPLSGLAAWFDHGGLIGVGGLLLGYYLAWTWGLRSRLRVRTRREAP